MDGKSGTILVPPAVKNSSCSHQRYSTHNFLQAIGIAETIEAILIVILTLGVIGANALVICVINNRRYAAYIHQQPRYLLTSLALNDLTIGLLITPFGLLPALFHCWPYGEIFCQIQALLRGALSQQSAVILVCMAVDRYMCALHPRRYYQHSSKKGCVAILSLTWIISLTIFGFLVFPKGYYFNKTGLMVCEPFFSKPSYRILATCAFYFPTTMILMYCYGSSFHMSRFRLNDPTMPLTAAAHHPAHQQLPYHLYHHYQMQQQQKQLQQQQHCHSHYMQHPHMLHSHVGGAAAAHHRGSIAAGSSTGGPHSTGLPSTVLPNTSLMNLSMAMSLSGLDANSITKKIVPIQEKNSSGSSSRSMAAISLGFIVMVTPWTIQEIVTACTGSKLPPFLDFIVTYTALSNSFWNPFMYWLLNADFRRLCRQLIPSSCKSKEDIPESKSPCYNTNSDFEITTLPMPPEPPTSRPPHGGSCDDADVSPVNAESNAATTGCLSKDPSATGFTGGGGSILGICNRRKTNSLNRSSSFHIRSSNGGAAASTIAGHAHSHVRPDIEGLSEKYWGEILERTVSTNSLHAAMQRSSNTNNNSQQYPQAGAGHSHAHPSTMTTSFSKHSDLNLHIREHDDSLVDAGNVYVPCGSNADYLYHQHHHHLQQQQQQQQLNNKLSNSESKLYDYDYHEHRHDVHCAKTKANTEANKNLSDVAAFAGCNTLASGRSIPDI